MQERNNLINELKQFIKWSKQINNLEKCNKVRKNINKHLEK